MSKLQPTHGKKGRGSTITMKETRAIAMQEDDTKKTTSRARLVGID
jgi:hypothetical protein